MKKLFTSRLAFFVFAALTASILTYFYFSPPSPSEILVGPLNPVCDSKCWQERREKFDVLLSERGLAAVLQTIGKLYTESADFRRWCNEPARRVGELAYQNFQDPAMLPLGPEILLCNYGFIHGYAETFFRETKELSRAKSLCNILDKRFKTGHPEVTQECFRGVGRGAINTADLIKNNARRITKEALKACDAITSNEAFRNVCASGLFNRLSRFYVEGDYDLHIDKADPLWFCHEQTEQNRLTCYASSHRIVNALLGKEKDNFRKTIKLYKRLYGEKRIDAVSAMAGGLAYDQARSKVMRGNHAEGIAACRQLDSPSLPSCLHGFAAGLAENGRPGYQYLSVLDFCKDATGGSTQNYTDCLRPALTYLKGVYAPQKFMRMCENIRYSLPDNFKYNVC